MVGQKEGGGVSVANHVLHDAAWLLTSFTFGYLFARLFR